MFPKAQKLSSAFFLIHNQIETLEGWVFVLIFRVGKHVPESPSLEKWLIIWLASLLIEQVDITQSEK